ncbi:hypothetical protein D770_05350 [Flammeovirgaceae bacterium 311]|nr:hypothetical protein D770_05350 [Flammeovirgaceae bacterium 311]
MQYLQTYERFLHTYEQYLNQENKLNDHLLTLYHSSPASNLTSILSHGLKINPPSKNYIELPYTPKYVQSLYSDYAPDFFSGIPVFLSKNPNLFRETSVDATLRVDCSNLPRTTDIPRFQDILKRIGEVTLYKQGFHISASDDLPSDIKSLIDGAGIISIERLLRDEKYVQVAFKYCQTLAVLSDIEPARIKVCYIPKHKK